MKRGKKLLILAGVLAVLVAVTLVVQGIVTRNEDAKTAAEDTSVTFLTVDPDAVTALQWTYNDETVSLTRLGGAWADADDAAFPVDAAYPDAMVKALGSVTASRAFAAGNPAEYGLDHPAYAVTVTADTPITLVIGNASDISGEYYASIGDGNVYLVASALTDPFAHGLWDILKLESVPDMTALSGIDIVTASSDTDISYLENSDYAYTDAYHWFLKQNGSYQALGSAADTLADGLKGLSWIRCVSYNASDADLAAYGLDKPGATAVLRYTAATDADAAETADAAAQSEPFILEIGASADDGYYARLQGSPMVYLIDSGLAQSILGASYATLQPTDVCLLDWDTVTSFDVTLDGETYTFERGTKDVTADDGTVTTEDIFLMNGAEVDSDLVNQVFDAIHGMSATGANTQTPGAVEIAFAFHRSTETFPELSLTFYRLNSTACVAGLDGETNLTVARADVVDLMEDVNAILLQ